MLSGALPRGAKLCGNGLQSVVSTMCLLALRHAFSLADGPEPLVHQAILCIQPPGIVLTGPLY